jgi:hypothetical protein
METDRFVSVAVFYIEMIILNPALAIKRVSKIQPPRMSVLIRQAECHAEESKRKSSKLETTRCSFLVELYAHHLDYWRSKIANILLEIQDCQHFKSCHEDHRLPENEQHSPWASPPRS